VTLSTTLVFATLTHINIRDGNLFLPARLHDALAGALRANLDLIVVVVWLLILTLVVMVKYGDLLFG
jgi:hypothetical protein